MMKKLTIIFCCFLMSSLNISFTAVNEAWNEAYANKNTTIYTRTTETGIKEFKAITTVNKNIKTVLAVMADYKSHPDWMRAIKSCKMVKQATSKTRYLHYAIDMPWPLWDRDLVSKSTFSLNADGSIFMKMSAAPKAKAKVVDHVRIQKSSGYWKVIPLKSNQTKIIYQYKADPVGIPATLVNMFLLEAPKATFEGLKKQILLSKYKNPNVDWLYK